MDHRAIMFEYVIWIKLAQDSVQWRDVTDMIMNLRVRQKAKNLSISQATISFSNGTSQTLSQ
jgi:hypothetical protein